MGNIKIVRGVFNTKLELELAGFKAGFPSPADIIGMRRWTSTMTTSVVLKLRSMAMWRVIR